MQSQRNHNHQCIQPSAVRHIIWRLSPLCIAALLWCPGVLEHRYEIATILFQISSLYMIVNSLLFVLSVKDGKTPWWNYVLCDESLVTYPDILVECIASTGRSYYTYRYDGKSHIAHCISPAETRKRASKT